MIDSTHNWVESNVVFTNGAKEIFAWGVHDGLMKCAAVMQVMKHQF